jgi:hypothetical protein
VLRDANGAAVQSSAVDGSATQIPPNGQISFRTEISNPARASTATVIMQAPPVSSANVWQRRFTGTWDVELPVPNGARLSLRTRYTSDGRFVATRTLTRFGGQPESQTMTGTWEVRAMLNAGDRAALVLRPENAGGAVTTVVVRWINDTTVYDETGGITMRRIGP